MEITRKIEPFHRVILSPERLPVPVREVRPEAVVAAFEQALDSPKLPTKYRKLATKAKTLGQVFGLDLSKGVEAGNISTLTLAELSGKPHKEILRVFRLAFEKLGWKLPKESQYKDSTNRYQDFYVLDHVEATAVAARLDPELVPLLTLALKFFQAAYLKEYHLRTQAQIEILEAHKEMHKLRSREFSTLASERQERLTALEENLRRVASVALKTSWQAAALLAPPLVQQDLPRWLFIHLTLNVHALSYMTIREAHFRRAFLHLLDDVAPEHRPPNVDVSYLTPEEIREVNISVPHREDTLDEMEAIQFDQDLTDPESWKVPPFPEGLPKGFTFADLWAMCDPITNRNHPLRRRIRDNPDVPLAPDETLP
jgi:hypothetical protein